MNLRRFSIYICGKTVFMSAASLVFLQICTNYWPILFSACGRRAPAPALCPVYPVQVKLQPSKHVESSSQRFLIRKRHVTTRMIILDGYYGTLYCGEKTVYSERSGYYSCVIGRATLCSLSLMSLCAAIAK